jgi:aminopeptidase YwaD
LFHPSPARNKNLRRWAEELASPGMQGRGYQNEGHKLAAAYLADQFESMGLKPLPALARNDQPWYQTFRFSTNLVQGPVSLSLNGKPLRVGEDFIVNPVSKRGELKELKVRDLGYGMPKDFSKSLKNTIVIIRSGLPPEIAKDPDLKKANERFASDLVKLDYATKMLAAAVIFVKPKLTAGFSTMPVELPVIDLLADRLPTKKIKTASLNLTTGIQAIQSQNVIGMVDGTRHPDSVIIVSAHYDHLGRQGDAIFYGGNDNASGTSMLLSLAQHYARPENRPPYSMLFIGFSGEEAGLIGSTHYAGKEPLAPLANTAFILNLDLMSNGNDGIMSVAGLDFPGHFELLKTINTRLEAVKEVKGRRNAPNSDHYPFVERGVKGMFIYTLGGPPHYHDMHDTYAHMEFQRYVQVRELMRGFLDALMAH